MNVVMVGNRLSLVSGHSRPAWQLARWLEERGHHASLVVSSEGPAALRRHEALVAQEGYESLWRRRLALPAGNGEFRRRLAPVLFAADVVHCFDLRALRAVRRLLGRSTQPKLALQVSSLPNLRPRDLRRAGWTAGLRALTRVQDAASVVVPAAVVRRLLDEADLLVCTSDFLARVMRERYRQSPTRLTVVHPGVQLQPAGQEPLEDRPDFVYFGWAGAHRGTLDAAKAFAAFLAEQPRAHCLVSSYRLTGRVGECALVFRALRKRFAPRGVQCSEFMPDIRQRIVGARAALLPFRSAFGYAQPPVVALEALAAGVPVISTDVGSVSEVIRDGQNGFLVPRGATEAMVERMRRLWSDEQLYRRLSANGRQCVAERFSLDGMFEKMVNAYERLLRP